MRIAPTAFNKKLIKRVCPHTLLDLKDCVERCRGLPDAERNGKLAPTGLGMDAEGCVTFGVQDGSVGVIEGGTEFGVALEEGEDADELDKVTLCGVGIVAGCHDDRESDFRAHHEEVNDAANDLLILELVDRGDILRIFEDIQGVGRSCSRLRGS